MDLSQRVIRTNVDWSAAGLLLIDYLAGRFTYRSKDEWCKRINSGEITLNDRIVPPETPLALHDRIEYRPQDIKEPSADLSYRIIHEDEKVLVIDKPGNLCMHPAGPFFKHTLWHLLCTRYGAIHFVNRLDRETSGLLLAAKDAATAKKLSKAVTLKKYLAIVHGDFPPEIEARGFLHSANSVVRKKRRFTREMPPVPPFESAVTILRKITGSGELSLVEAELFTGRMHQIRATLCSLGFPVAGDKLYGLDETIYLRQKSDELSNSDREKLLIPRQALHSAELGFTGIDGKEMLFSAPLPEDMQSLM